MRISVLVIAFLYLLPLAGQQNTNADVLARAELASKDIEIGDQIYLKVNLSAPPGTNITGLEPAFLNTITGIELVNGGQLNVVAETPERLLEQRFLITSFDTGYIAIAPLPYVFTGADGVLDTAYTNDLLLHVSAYPVTEDSELQPIKPIIEEPRNWLDFWPLYVVLLLAGLGYAAYVWNERRQRVAPPPPPPPPADLQALNALKALEAKSLWQAGNTKAYYTELTDILRTYLQDRFQVQAKEMTSRQITTALTKNVGMQPKLTGELAQLLQLSDLVKFAQATPAAELHPRSLERVREFVRETADVSTSTTPADLASTDAVVPPEVVGEGPRAIAPPSPNPAPARAPNSPRIESGTAPENDGVDPPTPLKNILLPTPPTTLNTEEE
ncbi:hypothetical protein [Lewinella sp. 4G2]|uniref:hypothetical protein n=1 Tax=Lewinella sp. 4G2 TaxID=1803372 RepID=UPI0007B4B5C7|nr:hypothetical protein [Lewinella sp. 4G2]OAV43768.1 hypothetical protein A3850_004325 [Lewinella sp. 4G2]